VALPPADEYRARFAARGATHAALTRTDSRFSAARLAVFGAFALLVVLAWRDVVAPAWLLVPVLGLAILIHRHDHVVRAREAAARAVAFYERGLLRIDDRWMGTGTTGERFRDDHHLYANDLDLFGRGSLFELLSLARTRAGEDALAAWLKAPAAPTEIRERQRAVAELTESLDFREAIALVGTDAASMRSDWLLSWAEGSPILAPPWGRWLALALTAAFAVTLTIWLTTDASTPMVVVLTMQIVLAGPLQKRVERLLHGADSAARDLDAMFELLSRIERETFTSPRLTAMRRQLDTDGIAASRATRQLHRFVEWHDWQHNIFFLIVSMPFMWGTHIAWAIEHWRRAHGHHVRVWLRTIGELEAVASVAAYRFEHPDDPFPDLVEPGDRHLGMFDGTGLCHPLLPASRGVRNDVTCGDPVQLLVVSGSNMSGKSTLLRTVGINTVLALAGAPVRAQSLRLTPLAIGATLRIQDSLQEGRSRFYAEITRIREITDLARGPIPLLFLLDELFHGTNSHDRLIGSSGVLRSLLDGGAIGLITTHDLALTGIARALAPRSVNVHFEDWFDGGELRFDYRLKTGPVTRSNAIDLMRAVGLNVPEEP
jgi:hypothetical protein